MVAARVFVVAALAHLCSGAYVLKDDYGSDMSFFDHFSFFTDDDPTHGYVNYVDRETAKKSGLISSDGSSVYMGVDHTNIAKGRGRDSVRIATKKSYQHGLFITDMSHMAGGVCGTWPAFWTAGATWPGSGEIDIMEGVNENDAAEFTIHSGPGCSVGDGEFSGKMTTSDCDVEAEGQLPNEGCNVIGDNPASFGKNFNSNDGGVYAMEWTSDAISMWFFPRGKIPTDVDGNNPDPSTWGKPMAQFKGACDIDQTVDEQHLVLNTNFCGDWSGSEWAGSSCSSKAPTCDKFVQNNPEAFKDVYWNINSFKIYQKGNSSPNPGNGPETTKTEPQAPKPTETEPTEKPTETAEPTEPKPQPPAPTEYTTEQPQQPPAPETTEEPNPPGVEPVPVTQTLVPEEPEVTKKPSKTITVTNTVTVCPAPTGLSQGQKRSIPGHRRKYAPVYQG